MAEESFRKWDQERKAQRMEYWTKLRRANDDYERTECLGYDASLSGFRYWMERKWGIEIEIIDGHFGQNFNVKDKKKYMLFLMKY